jgi:hypothetical protein
MAGGVGARVPIGRVSLRGELIAGVHGASLGGMSSVQADSAPLPLVEPRIAADVWLSPWWVLEAFAGTNVIDRSEHVVGLGLGLHFQAFDGRYR